MITEVNGYGGCVCVCVLVHRILFSLLFQAASWGLTPGQGSHVCFKEFIVCVCLPCWRSPDWLLLAGSSIEWLPACRNCNLHRWTQLESRKQDFTSIVVLLWVFLHCSKKLKEHFNFQRNKLDLKGKKNHAGIKGCDGNENIDPAEGWIQNKKKIFFLKSEKMAAASRLRLSVLRALSLESPSCS